VSPQSTKMEFMISAVDYLLGDFVGYLKEEKLLDNTVVYIYPDHLKMGMTSELREVGNRGLFMLTNASENSLSEICGYFGLTVPGISVKMCQSERWCNRWDEFTSRSSIASAIVPSPIMSYQVDTGICDDTIVVFWL
jgi:hypothetical protein